jgi:hypothetical protein
MDDTFGCERCGATHALVHATDMVFRRGERCERVFEVCPSCVSALIERGWTNAHVFEGCGKRDCESCYPKGDA